MKSLAMSRAQIEQSVQLLIDKHGVCSAPVPVDLIAKAEGLPIVETSLRSDVSGALLRRADVSAIAVNNAHPHTRRRFTIAHELGHHILRHPGEADHLDWQFTVIRRDGASSDRTDTYEMEANFFAASLLMPREWLRKDVEARVRANHTVGMSEQDISTLASRYEVSSTSMKYRLMNLALIPPD